MVEPPGGDRYRITEQSYWAAYNGGKSSITLATDTKDGKYLLYELIRKVDFFIVSYDYVDSKKPDIEYEEISKINKNIIMVSISGFGKGGQCSHWRTSDIVSMAKGGMMYLCGDTDRAPVRIDVEQAYLHAGAEAAEGALIAFWERGKSGLGQFVDVSMQESVIWSLMDAMQYWDLSGHIIPRAGQSRWTPNTKYKTIWECKDGYVFLWVGGGVMHGKTIASLVSWMKEENVAPGFLTEINWLKFDRNTASAEQYAAIEKPIAEFFRLKTKEELWQNALSRKMILYPLSTSIDLFNSQHLQEREFWEEIYHADLHRNIKYPGAAVKLNKVQLKKPAGIPRVGEHNHNIYINLLNMQPDDLIFLVKIGVI